MQPGQSPHEKQRRTASAICLRSADHLSPIVVEERPPTRAEAEDTEWPLSRQAHGANDNLFLPLWRSPVCSTPPRPSEDREVQPTGEPTGRQSQWSTPR